MRRVRAASSPYGRLRSWRRRFPEPSDEPYRAATLRFVPHRRQEDLVTHYRAADLLLHAARPESENFPNVVLEALACGTPVVANRVGGVPEQIVDGRTGVLVAERDVPGFARAVESLLADGPRRRAMSVAATADVARRFTLTRMLDGYLSWYAEVLAARDGSS